MSWLDRLSEGLSRTREQFNESMNVLFNRGPNLDQNFYDSLEEALIQGDMGAISASEIVEQLQETAKRKALPDARAVLDLLAETIADRFVEPERDPFDTVPGVVAFRRYQRSR